MDVTQNEARVETRVKRVSFKKAPGDNFQQTVNERVRRYFKTEQISQSANGAMWRKVAVVLTVWLGSYFLIISNLVSPWLLLPLALLHGFATAMVGLNIGHDAVHGSLASSATGNRRLALLFNIAGANDYLWKLSHNLVHHTFTNIPHHDGDIRSLPVLRMEPTQPLWSIHRFQYIYAFGFYSVSSLVWVFLKDYVYFFKQQLGAHTRDRLPVREVARLFFYKAVYYTLFLVAPLVLIDLAWYWILLGFVASHLVEGLTLTITFMLAHIMEGTQFPEPGPDGKVDLEWAELQLLTTSNFATRSRVVNYLLGGLNFQVEHHLFPAICHIHYPKIAAIVRQTAREYDLEYREQPTFWSALISHITMLKRFGREVSPT